MALRAAAVALLIPLLLFATLLLVPGFDQPWGTFAFHFYVVSAASLLAAATCALLILSARSIRETRILFLALTFLSLGTIFSIHGLTTPGHFYHLPSAALERSPWLATLVAGFFATLSVVSIPRVIEQSRLRLPEATFACCGAVIASYFIVSLLFPDWLTGFPTREEWFQHVLTAVTLGLLGFAAYRYLDSYLFTRLPSQIAVSVGLLFIAEAQLSLDFGAFWHYSWWLYHGLFLAAFGAVLGGWTLELLRARDARSIAEAIAMRDALTQLKRGRPSPLVSLADQIENHDLETHRHVDRVAAYALSIGRQMGFGTARLRDLVLAAQMHDIGKIGLPPYILTKPGKLTDAEWAAIKQHPGKGWEIVARLRGLQQIADITTSASTAPVIPTASPATRSRSKPESSPWPTRSTP